MRNLIPLLRRELREHRAIVFAPAAFMGVTLFAVAVGLVQGRRFLGSEIPLEHVSGLGSVELSDGLGAIVQLIWLEFALLGAVLAAFYLLDALYADRKDRSVLFWKSMPVSDFETVLSKALTALVVIPLVMCAFALVEVLALIPLGSLAIGLLGGNPWNLLIAPFPWFSGAGHMLVNSAVFALWFLPVAAYLLLCSAFARKAPFLWAILVPVAIALVERMIFGSSQFLEMIGTYFQTFFETVGHIGSDAHIAFGPRGLVLDGNDNIPLNAAAALTQPLLYIGMALGAAMLALTVRLRRVRIDAG